MPNNRPQSPSTEEQSRWQRELEISRLLAQQKSPGFFPGPGAATGGGGGATGGSEMQGVNAAKDMLSGNASASDMANNAAAIAIKEILDKVVWPDLLDIVDGSCIIAITILQFWWVCAMLKVKGTFKPTLREHFQLGLATLIELFILIFIGTIISILACSFTPSCAVDMLKSFHIKDVFSLLKLL
jgi:hypothetical protein